MYLCVSSKKRNILTCCFMATYEVSRASVPWQPLALSQCAHSSWTLLNNHISRGPLPNQLISGCCEWIRGCLSELLLEKSASFVGTICHICAYVIKCIVFNQQKQCQRNQILQKFGFISSWSP